MWNSEVFLSKLFVGSWKGLFRILKRSVYEIILFCVHPRYKIRKSSSLILLNSCFVRLEWKKMWLNSKLNYKTQQSFGCVKPRLIHTVLLIHTLLRWYNTCCVTDLFFSYFSVYWIFVYDYLLRTSRFSISL